ncbi:WD_REPEATS_REGION domain-containing protein, partial [Linnemannia zychae]
LTPFYTCSHQNPTVILPNNHPQELSSTLCKMKDNVAVSLVVGESKASLQSLDPASTPQLTEQPSVTPSVDNNMLGDIQSISPAALQGEPPLTPSAYAQSIMSEQHATAVEYHLNAMMVLRLREEQQQVYIPPLAKAGLLASDDDFFPLMDKVREFLASDRQVMLIQGGTGTGKTTFNKHLELALLHSYTPGGGIPLFINLPAIEGPEKDLITKQLKTYNFTEKQIQELRQHRRFIVICDGYDESQLTKNLHTSNMFNQPDQWNVKLLISCRSQYLGQDYRNLFVPQGDGYPNRQALDLFQEAVIAPFSEEQIQSYIDQYVHLEPRTWTAQDYMEKLSTISSLMNVVNNPFLLSITLEALPKITENWFDFSTIKATRVQLFGILVDRWLDLNKRRFSDSVSSTEDQAWLGELVGAGFVSECVEYSTKLASAIVDKQDGNPEVLYLPDNDENTWKAEFFGSHPRIQLLLQSIPLTRTVSQFQFLHRSMLEYFLSCTVFDPRSYDEVDRFSSQPNPHSMADQLLDPHGPLFKLNLLCEPSVIQFLCGRVIQYPFFKSQLLAVIELSKTDVTASVAATNAITILVRAGAGFSGTDLRGVRIPAADISGSQFESRADLAEVNLKGVNLKGVNLKGVNLTGVNLTGVNLSKSWLKSTDLSSAQMGSVGLISSP